MAGGPLALFRKHQKTLLALFGVAIMIAFLLPSASMRFFNGSGNDDPQNDVVVHWNAGELNENEMYALRAEHSIVLRILYNLVAAAEQKGGTPNAIGIVRDPRTNLIVEPGISVDNSGRALLQTVLLANRAKQLGIVVNDQIIQNFLEQLTGSVLSGDEIGSIVKSASPEGMDQNSLFRVLGRYLAAQKTMVLAISGMRMGTPGENWDYFNRLHRQVTAEIKPVPVSNFIDKIEKPSNSEIQSLYQKYKDRVDDPNDSEPGFKLPARTSLDFVVADMRQFRTEAEESITDEEIQAYYDENLDEFKRTEPPAEETEPDVEDGSSTEGDSQDSSVENEDNGDTPPAGENPNEAATETDLPTEENTSPSETEAASETPSGDSEPVDDGASGPPQIPTPESINSDDPRQAVPQPPVPKTDDQSSLSETSSALLAHTTTVGAQRTPTRVVSTSDLQKNESVEDIIVRGQDSAEDTGEEPDSTVAESSEPNNSTAEVASSEDLDTGSNQPTSSDLDLDFDLDSQVSDEPDYGHYTLDEVRDRIRTNLAVLIASEAVRDKMQQIQREMRKYFDEHRLWLANQAQGLETKEPARTDLQQLADEHGLVAGSVPLVDRRELISQHEIGRSQVIEGRNAVPIADMLLGTNLLPFMPKDAFLYDRNTQTEKYFVFWKSGSEEERVPQLDEVHDTVVNVWKTEQALDLAQAEAEKLAQKVGKSGQRLSDISSDNVTEVGPFSWYTVVGMTDDPRGQFFLSPVEGVEQIGNEFMRSTFSLSAGEAGTAVNRTESIVYVVQVIDETTNPEQRQQEFFENLDENGGFNPQLMRIAEIERRELLRQWYLDIEEELEVVWNRPPEPATIRR